MPPPECLPVAAAGALASDATTADAPVAWAGVLAAAGSSGMAQRFSEDSPQRSLLIETGENPAVTELTLYDSTGRERLRWTAEKAYSCVIVNLPSLTEGESYTLKSGDSEKTICRFVKNMLHPTE